MKRVHHDCWKCPHLIERRGGGCLCVRIPRSWYSNLKISLLGYPSGLGSRNNQEIEFIGGQLKSLGPRDTLGWQRLQPKGEWSPSLGGRLLGGALLIALILILGGYP